MKRTLFFLLTLIALPAAAQNSGLFGKTSFVEVTGVGNFSLMNRWLNNDYYYKRNGQNLMKAKDLVNGGVYVAVGTAVKRNVALTLEAGWWMFNTDGPSIVRFSAGDYYSSTMEIRHENLDVRTFSIMPIVEIGGKEGLLPIGISHQIGVGYTSSKPVEKDYLYAPAMSGPFSYYDELGNYHSMDSKDFLDSLHTVQGGFADFKNKQKGVTLLYGLKVRTPISENVMLNYGVRYTLNFGSKSGRDQYDFDKEAWTQDEIRRARFYSFISVNFGVSYAF